jgi:hypothetical protein
VPAAAVIPIPIAYIKFVVVEVFVVSVLGRLLLGGLFYFEKIGVFQTDCEGTIKHRIIGYECLVFH